MIYSDAEIVTKEEEEFVIIEVMTSNIEIQIICDYITTTAKLKCI